MVSTTWVRSGVAALTLAVLGSGIDTVNASENAGLYVIYDSSNSMWAALPDGSRKYEAARSAMRNLMAEELGSVDVALRMYGHRRKDDCSDSELVVPFQDARSAAAQMIDAMEAVRPTGRTPIDRSLRQALDDFGDRSGSIVLISDGIESCDADPCALVQSWSERDIDISVFVVGLGLAGKERAAMQCIADASGTAYRDAFSANELLEGLSAAVEQTQAEEPPEPQTPEPKQQVVKPDFALIVETEDGVRQRGLGVLTDQAGTDLPVETNKRYTPEPGDYQLSAGVRVVGGEAYKPVTIDLLMAESGRTEGLVKAPTPPMVTARFSMAGEALKPTVVTVYRDGKKLGSFSGDTTAFVPEGTLEFVSTLRGTSEPLSVQETFAAGDIKDIHFEAAIEVRLNVFALASSTGERLKGRPNTKLLDNGEVVHTINSASGGLVTPGRYTMLIQDNFNSFETEIEVSREAEQTPEFEVPAGSLRIEYRDISGNVEAAKRVFVENSETRLSGTRTSEERFAVLPGRYLVTGWPKKNGYVDQEIDVAAGQDLVVVMQATQ